MSHTPLHTQSYRTQDIIIESSVWGITGILLTVFWHILVRQEASIGVLIGIGALSFFAFGRTFKQLLLLKNASKPAFTLSRSGILFADGTLVHWHAVKKALRNETAGSIVLFLKPEGSASLRDKLRMICARTLYRLTPIMRGKNIIIIRPLLESSDEIFTLIESLLT
jgi:hypothetical protein